MSFHIVHIFDHGGSLHKDRGRLYFKNPKGMQSLPIENIRAVIIAAKGISISSQLIAALLEVDCLLLHCDHRYQPIGWTLPTTRTMHQDVIQGQVNPRGRLHQRLWQAVLRQKISNQREILNYAGVFPNPLDKFLDGVLHEGHAARVFFGNFFRTLDATGQSRGQKHRGWLNGLLNYGYAVLAAMVHRSLIVHGLMANLGIHHKARYRSYPLVYDLMEPLRPVVDGLILNWVRTAPDIPVIGESGEAINSFGKFIGTALREYRIRHTRYSLKLVDGIDFYVRSIANAFQSQSESGIWLPSIEIEALESYGKS